MGANNQRPPLHAPNGRPADNIATVVVRFPPIVRSPTQPLPILWVVVSLSSSYSSLLQSSSNRHSPIPVVFPASPPFPLPSCHCPQSCLPIAALTASQGMPVQTASLWRAAFSTLPHCLVVRFDVNATWKSSCELCFASGRPPAVDANSCASKAKHNSFEISCRGNSGGRPPKCGVCYVWRAGGNTYRI